MNDEVDILHVDKHESMMQIDTMILMGMAKHSQSSRNSKFAISLQYLNKEVLDEVDFCLQINITVSYKLILTFWASKFPAR